MPALDAHGRFSANCCSLFLRLRREESHGIDCDDRTGHSDRTRRVTVSTGDPRRYMVFTSGDAIAACAFLAIAAILVSAFVLHASWLLQNRTYADWLMVAARRLLAGGRYVSEFDEATPPLILLLLTPPAALASLTGLDPYSVFLGYVCLLIAGSVFLARPVLSWCVDGDPLLGGVVVDRVHDDPRS